jgi:hypothetical protein
VTRTHQDIVAELIAQAVQQVQGAIGVLIRDIPFVAPMPLLGQLRKLEEAGAGLRVAYLAPPGGQAAAEAVGFDLAHFSVEVEQAERWRNQRELDATIVVVAAADVAKLSSLQDFEHITSRALKEQLARQVLGAQGSANEVQGRWWRLLRDDERISLGQLVDYYATLEPLPEADFIVQASREIHRLGLLPDPALFDNPRESAIRRRMQDNRELLGRLQTLTEQDRKIIANNIGNEQDATQRARLARSLRHLRQLRRGGHGLDRLPLQDAQDLLAIRRPARPPPPPPPAGAPPPRPGSSETRARARVRHVNSRGLALGHTREGDEKDVWGRARVDDLIHLARSLNEGLPRTVRGGLALPADRSVNRERARLNDDDRAPGMGVPAGGAARIDRDLRHGYVRSDLKWDRPI